MADHDITGEDHADQAEPIITTIYVLKDPKTLNIRYMGHTINPIKNRLIEHVREAFDISSPNFRSRKSKWIRSLYEAGKVPQISAVESFEGPYYVRYNFYLEFYKVECPDLLNSKNDTEEIKFKAPDIFKQKKEEVVIEKNYKINEQEEMERLLKYSTSTKNSVQTINLVQDKIREIPEIEESFIYKKMLLLIIASGKNGITERELSRALSWKNLSRRNLDAALDCMEQNNLIKRTIIKTGGRDRRAIISTI